MSPLQRFMSFLFSLFPGNATLASAAKVIGDASPFLFQAADFVSKKTSWQWDNQIVATLRTQFPRLFDGTPLTQDEVKLYTLAIATEFLKWKFPTLSTTAARLAIQAAYAGNK
jgi:hypothetical protein